MNRELGKYLGAIQACALFSGMDSASILVMLDTLHARLAYFDADQVILAPGDSFMEACIVLDGHVEASYINVDGLSVNLAMIAPGGSLGIEFVWTGKRKSPVYVTAMESCAVLLFDLDEPRRRTLHRELEVRLLTNIADMLARDNITLYNRVWIYGQKHIRARLKIYLLSLPREGDTVTLPMKRAELAEYLGVDRSALSRELSRMQSEGLVALNRREIRLMDSGFFSFADHNGGSAGAKENGQSPQ